MLLYRGTTLSAEKQATLFNRNSLPLINPKRFYRRVNLCLAMVIIFNKFGLDQF